MVAYRRQLVAFIRDFIPINIHKFPAGRAVPPETAMNDDRVPVDVVFVRFDAGVLDSHCYCGFAVRCSASGGESDGEKRSKR